MRKTKLHYSALYQDLFFLALFSDDPILSFRVEHMQPYDSFLMLAKLSNAIAEEWKVTIENRMFRWTENLFDHTQSSRIIIVNFLNFKSQQDDQINEVM